MIAVNNVALTEYQQQAFIQNRKVRFIFMAGKMAYEADLLSGLIAEALLIDPYSWDKPTGTELVDALVNAQYAMTIDRAAQRAAYDWLITAIDGLTAAVFDAPKSKVIKVGAVVDLLEEVVTYTGWGAITFATSNAALATVTSAGVLTGVKAGTAIITISAVGYSPRAITVQVAN